MNKIWQSIKKKINLFINPKCLCCYFCSNPLYYSFSIIDDYTQNRSISGHCGYYCRNCFKGSNNLVRHLFSSTDKNELILYEVDIIYYFNNKKYLLELDITQKGTNLFSSWSNAGDTHIAKFIPGIPMTPQNIQTRLPLYLTLQ